ncbi:MAG: response regulator [Verrucomicrobiota bacterium]|nr:response regulator [Verrucomicrobiota bacterium]
MNFILVALVLVVVIGCLYILYRETRRNKELAQEMEQAPLANEYTEVEVEAVGTMSYTTEVPETVEYAEAPCDQVAPVEEEAQAVEEVPVSVVVPPQKGPKSAPMSVPSAATDAWPSEIGASSPVEALFATLSHELRTPLNGILGMSQIMRAEAPDDERLVAIEAASRHMMTLLANLVNLRKLQTEAIEENREWCQPQELLDEVRQRLRFRARTRGLDLIVRPESQQKRIRWDREHLLSILENLILASIEETPLGQKHETATFALSWVVTNDDKSLVFSLENPCESWRADREQTQFEPFGSTVGTSHQRVRIDGLLRAVAKGLVTRRNGDISYKPRDDGGGVVCHIFLAIEQVMTGAAGLTRAPFSSLSLQTRSLATTTKQLHILLAEDDPTNQKVIAYMLAKMGHTLTITNNGQEALDVFQSNPHAVDLILMDIDMPVMDGVRATVNLRSGDIGPKGLTVPIAAVTAFATTSDQGRFFKIGMNYFLSKPISSDKLRTLFLEVERKQRA